MKKYLFLFTALFLYYQSHAQQNIGVMAGTGFSNLRIRNVPDLIAPLLPSEYNNICTFYIGGSADFALSDLIYLTPELFYANRGWKCFIDPGLAGQQVAVDYEAYNWSFQVGLKYNFMNKTDLKTIEISCPIRYSKHDIIFTNQLVSEC